MLGLVLGVLDNLELRREAPLRAGKVAVGPFGKTGLGHKLLASAGALAPFGLLHPHEAAIRRLYASMAAGAVGAIVSVLMRMSRLPGTGSDFKIDHELGSAGVRRLGALRPLVGAVSGVVVALLVQTTLVASQNGSVTTAFFVVMLFTPLVTEMLLRLTSTGPTGLP